MLWKKEEEYMFTHLQKKEQVTKHTTSTVQHEDTTLQTAKQHTLLVSMFPTTMPQQRLMVLKQENVVYVDIKKLLQIKAVKALLRHLQKNGQVMQADTGMQQLVDTQMKKVDLQNTVLATMFQIMMPQQKQMVLKQENVAYVDIKTP